MTPIKLPHKCFVSHSYRDEEARHHLEKTLPSHVKPIIFPPINVRPDQMVSNALIEAILNCDALIYLEKGYSSQSFWVAFERDYALRAGKPLYRFDPETGELTLSDLQPIDLPVFPAFIGKEYKRVEDLLKVMRQDRHFDLFVPQWDIQKAGLWGEVLQENMYKSLTRGGYVVAFWSHDANLSNWFHETVEKAYQYFLTDDPSLDRLIFALLDDTPMPEWYLDRLKMSQPDMLPTRPIQLYSDHQFSLMNRIDDLIVRLYWLLYQNSYMNVFD